MNVLLLGMALTIGSSFTIGIGVFVGLFWFITIGLAGIVIGLGFLIVGGIIHIQEENEVNDQKL